MEKKKKDKQSFKDIVKNSFSNGSKWVEKHKVVSYIILGLIAVILAISVCFCSYRRDNVTAMAYSGNQVVDYDAYYLSTYNNPCFYTTTTNSGAVVALTTCPLFVLGDDGWRVYACGNLSSPLLWAVSGAQLPTISVVGYNTRGSSGAINPTQSNNSFQIILSVSGTQFVSMSSLFSDLRSGNTSLVSVRFYNRVYGTYNYAQYDLQFTNYPLFTVELRHAVNPTSNFSYTQDSNSINFTYTWVYNGLLTDSQQYQLGYDTGRTSISQEQYDVWYDQGKSAGETLGYNRGISEKLENITPWQSIVNAVDSFFQIEILPSVTISTILMVGFGVLLLGIAIKVFLGG